MLLKKYLTEYDEDLSGDVYIDPLGTLVIWSTFGQEIFQNKVNSISNDVRNYTLNMLNHAVIKSLVDDESVVLNKSLIDEIGHKNSLQFKQACLIYLENIFTFSMSNPNTPEIVDKNGVLGSSKAKKLWEESAGDPLIYFTQQEYQGKKRYHILVRQLSLGVSGRYKTPFSMIGFYEDQYDYHSPNTTTVWNEVDSLLKRSGAIREVFEQAREHLTWLIKNHTSKGQMPPAVRFGDIPKALITAYQNTLCTAAQAGQEARDFWLKITRLNEGAAGALLKELEKSTERKSKDINYEALFSDALSHEDSLTEEESRKLTDIQILEPLLSELDLLFSVARHKKTQSTSDVIANWEERGRNDATLPTLADRVVNTPGLKDVVSGTAAHRLEQLLEVASRNKLELQLHGLLEYHKKIMRGRGQQPWVEIIDKKTIKTYARTSNLSDKKDPHLVTWVNTYYIPQFKNIVDGFRGVNK